MTVSQDPDIKRQFLADPSVDSALQVFKQAFGNRAQGVDRGSVAMVKNAAVPVQSRAMALPPQALDVPADNDPLLKLIAPS
eukprot:15457532-Alexandrium_andersonii.AAC.1